MRRADRCLGPAALALALLSLAWSGPAEAHTAGTTGFATVTVAGQTVRYVLTLSVDALEMSRAAPVATERGSFSVDYDALASMVARYVAIAADGTACAPLPGTVQPPSPGRPTVVIVIHYACAAPVRILSLRDDLFVALGRDHHTLANIEWPGGHEQLVFEPDRREARVALGGEAASSPAGGSAESGALAFFRLGIEHILTGFDHILFLLALILRGGRIGSLLGIVTAFTVAHSATLALAVLNVVAPPARLVEPLIALSIAYVALENIFFERTPSRRWVVSFLFGLVHGFGFAGALLELGLPRRGLVESLVFFNLGVEAGQAMIVTLFLPALLWLCRYAWERRAVTTLSAVVFVAAVALLIERALFPDG